MSLPSPLALTPCFPTELLSYVLQQVNPTALLICGSRTAFLSSLLDATSLPPTELQTPQDPHSAHDHESSQPPPPQLHPSPDPEDVDLENQRPTPKQPPRRHPLLTPTLHQISLSQNTTTAFIPTVSHLRAYLSVDFEPPLRKDVSTGKDNPRTRTQFPLLVVYGLVELHRGTSEWSTQGLGNTCAALVEAGRRTGRRVVIVEERRTEENEEERGLEESENVDGDNDDGGEEGDGLEVESDGKNAREGACKGVWHEKLPILSGNVRRAGAKMEYGGRTVEVGMVLRRWFKFERWEQECGGYA